MIPVVAGVSAVAFFSACGRSPSSDLEAYRSGYPGQRDDLSLSSNQQFFSGKLRSSPDDVTIDEMLDWKGDYRRLEFLHGYIQWLFPIRERGVNWDAQPLQAHEITVMKADPAIVERATRGFEMMLDFYGFALDRSSSTISRAPKYENQFYNLNTSGHNYLRITRILKFLGEMGLEPYKIAWLNAFYHEIYETKALRPCQSSFENYWIGTIYDDEIRQRMFQSVAAARK